MVHVFLEHVRQRNLPGYLGFQGDIQHRSWNLLGDLEQRLLRGGLTYTPPEWRIKFTLGYGNIASGAFGSSDATSYEHRIYQEALIPHKLGSRFHFTHRFRYERRFVEDQDFRTRYRYNLFLNIPLNTTEFEDTAPPISSFTTNSSSTAKKTSATEDR